MALAQTEAIARLLRAADPALDVEIVKFETRGDQDQTSKLLRHGGKGGAFVAEIREAMRARQLQAAMHSLKDVPGNEETPGLIIAATLPAVGQGIVAVECVENDWLTRGRLAKIEDAASRRCAEAEREVLWVLNGHCNSPIAGHATLACGEMTLTAAVLDETGDRFIEVSRQGAADRPRELGRAVGLALLDQGAAETIARPRPAEP